MTDSFAVMKAAILDTIDKKHSRKADVSSHTVGRAFNGIEN